MLKLFSYSYKTCFSSKVMRIVQKYVEEVSLDIIECRKVKWA